MVAETAGVVVSEADVDAHRDLAMDAAAVEVAGTGREGMECTVEVAEAVTVVGDGGERNCAVGFRLTGCDVVNRDDPVAPSGLFRSSVVDRRP